MTSIIPRKRRRFNETSAGDSAVPTGNTPDGSNNHINTANPISFDAEVPFDDANNSIETNPTIPFTDATNSSAPTNIHFSDGNIPFSDASNNNTPTSDEPPTIATNSPPTKRQRVRDPDGNSA